MKNWQKIRQNPELVEQFLVREQVMDGIRSFFKNNNFHEVETPSLVRYPGTEPFLEVFSTQMKTATGESDDAYLITSPEFAMKKLLTAGLGNIFQVCKSFRNNEGLSSRHNLEFSILEWYRVDADYTDIMKDCEELLTQLVGSPTLEYQGRSYDISAPWPRISVAEAFAKYADVEIETLLSEEKILEVGRQKGYQVDEGTTWEQMYNQIFANEVEVQLAKLNTPVIVYDYPASQAALSKKKKSDPRFAERFEFYLAGLELGNAFSELNDPIEQEVRIDEDLKQRKKMGKVEYSKDDDFINALKAGMPDSAGIAVGVDRLAMLLADVGDISEITFFPGEEIFSLSSKK